MSLAYHLPVQHRNCYIWSWYCPLIQPESQLSTRDDVIDKFHNATKLDFGNACYHFKLTEDSRNEEIHDERDCFGQKIIWKIWRGQSCTTEGDLTMPYQTGRTQESLWMPEV